MIESLLSQEENLLNLFDDGNCLKLEETKKALDVLHEIKKVALKALDGEQSSILKKVKDIISNIQLTSVNKRVSTTRID